MRELSTRNRRRHKRGDAWLDALAQRYEEAPGGAGSAPVEGAAAHRPVAPPRQTSSTRRQR